MKAWLTEHMSLPRWGFIVLTACATAYVLQTLAWVLSGGCP